MSPVRLVVGDNSQRDSIPRSNRSEPRINILALRAADGQNDAIDPLPTSLAILNLFRIAAEKGHVVQWTSIRFERPSPRNNVS
jgi:hypothetical protein